MFNRRLLVYQGGTPEPPLPTNETVLWRDGAAIRAFTITIPPGVKVLKITTEIDYINMVIGLPIYIGVTGGKTYNIRCAVVVTGRETEPEYLYVQVYRYNSPSDSKQWVNSEYGEEPPEGTYVTSVKIIMSYSASINGVTPDVLDY